MYGGRQIPAVIGPIRIFTLAVCATVVLFCLFVFMLRLFGPLVVASNIYKEQPILLMDLHTL